MPCFHCWGHGFNPWLGNSDRSKWLLGQMNQDHGQIPLPSSLLPSLCDHLVHLAKNRSSSEPPKEVMMTTTVLVIIKTAFIFELLLSWAKILVWILSLGPHQLPECIVIPTLQRDTQVTEPVSSQDCILVGKWTNAICNGLSLNQEWLILSFIPSG